MGPFPTLAPQRNSSILTGLNALLAGFALPSRASYRVCGLGAAARLGVLRLRLVEHLDRAAHAVAVRRCVHSGHAANAEKRVEPPLAAQGGADAGERVVFEGGRL